VEQATAASSSSAARCPKCGAGVIPGSVHCIKCGWLVDATEDDPDRPLKKIFKWWLLFYGFWRIVGVVLNGLAALGSPPGSDAALFFRGLFLLVALSLFSIVMLWQGRKWGLPLFIGAEVAGALWAFAFGDFLAPFFVIIPILIMWIVSTRAKFQRA
jgi:hypothetical protein